MNESELKDRIAQAKEKLGNKLVILGHHYQREEIITFADFRGDSFGLSKIASEQKDAKFIVFCGVRFMAEAARILARPEQRVFHPDPTSGCPMADMADIDDVEDAWKRLSGLVDIKKVIPVAYMNTKAELKAFCGKNGGIICTSSNAPKAFEWAFARGEKIFFFPDEHLGRNTARRLKISREEIGIFRASSTPQAGDESRNEVLDFCLDRLDIRSNNKIRVLLWPGHCHVHTYFTIEHVKAARESYPDCKIIVHPECTEDVVMASDESASTEGICKYVAAQQKGTTIVVGTEINLVARLARENPHKNVIPLVRSLCPNMFKISLADLSRTLDGLVDGKLVNEVIVPEEIVVPARTALERMLTI